MTLVALRHGRLLRPTTPRALTILMTAALLCASALGAQRPAPPVVPTDTLVIGLSEALRRGLQSGEESQLAEVTIEQARHQASLSLIHI